MAAVAAHAHTFEEEVLSSKLPVLLDFWAPWCGPCRMFSPVVEELSEAYAGRLKVLKVNVDEEPSLAQRFGVMSIPTVVIMRDGKAFDYAVGVQSRAALEKMLQKAGCL